MTWQPIVGGLGGYMIGGSAGAVADAVIPGPDVGALVGSVGGAYLGYRYVAAHPALAVPMLLGGLLARVVHAGLASSQLPATSSRGWG